MFSSEIHNSDKIAKIFTGYAEWADRHPHVKYLSNWGVFKIFTYINI